MKSRSRLALDRPLQHVLRLTSEYQRGFLADFKFFGPTLSVLLQLLQPPHGEIASRRLVGDLVSRLGWAPRLSKPISPIAGVRSSTPSVRTKPPTALNNDKGVQ